MPKNSWLDFFKPAPLKAKITYISKQSGTWPFIIAGLSAIAVIVTFILVIAYANTPINTNLAFRNLHVVTTAIPDDPDEDPRISEDQTPNQVTTSPEFISLQPVVDAWRKTTSADIGLMIYDLDNDRTAASYQSNKTFNVASVYKLFFAYDGYRQLEAGNITADTRFVTTSDYRAGTYTFGECLDLIIRESYNGCADEMRSDSKAFARVSNLIKELSLNNTTNGGLSSTAADITALLKLYYVHSDLSDANWQKIADSMLNQPPTKINTQDTVYDWRQGLPSGFSKQAIVYNKVGWAWNEDKNTWTTYADAAIVEFPAQNRHYIMVVLTSNLPGRTPTALAELATKLEDAITSQSGRL